MAKNIAPILKNTKEGLCNTACSECGKDMCPLTLKPGLYSKPVFKNCMSCRARKAGSKGRMKAGKALLADIIKETGPIPAAIKAEVKKAWAEASLPRAEM